MSAVADPATLRAQRRIGAERLVVAAALDPSADHDRLDRALAARAFVVDPRHQATLDAAGKIRAQGGAIDELGVATALEGSKLPAPQAGWWDGWTRALTTRYAPVTPGQLARACGELRTLDLADRLLAVVDGHDLDGDQSLQERVRMTMDTPDDDRELVTISEWDTTTAAPDREWVSPGWIPASRVTILSGIGGAGKSLLCLQLMAAVASRGPSNPSIDDPHREPFGARVYPPHAPRVDRRGGAGHALCIGWEDESDEILRRLQWIGADGAMLDQRLHYVSMEGLGPLWGPEQGQHESVMATVLRLGRRLEHEVAHISQLDNLPLRLVCIDPAAGAFGSNENSRTLVRQFMGWLGSLARSHGFAALLVAHPPKGGGAFSGSTDWQAGARSLAVLEVAETNAGEPMLTKSGEPWADGRCHPAPAWRLARTKSNYARKNDHAWLIKHVKTEGGRLAELRWEEASAEEAAAAFAVESQA